MSGKSPMYPAPAMALTRFGFKKYFIEKNAKWWRIV
jgi:hypothetical protein